MAAFSSKPNILITGTPGTGKTTLSNLIAERIGANCIDVSSFVAQHECHEGYDEAFQTLILDEDKLCDLLEPIVSTGGNVVDFHTCEIFPERWFHLVIVLRVETEVLYDRLLARQYTQRKLDENMECEIMQIVLENARESYAHEIVQELSRQLKSFSSSTLH
jgi:adenylate kinase